MQLQDGPLLVVCRFSRTSTAVALGVPRRLCVRGVRLASPLGLLLALLPKPVYPFYVAARPRVLGLSPLADEELAGMTMAAEQAIVLFAVFAYWFRRFFYEEGLIRARFEMRSVSPGRAGRARCASSVAAICL